MELDLTTFYMSCDRFMDESFETRCM